MPKPVVVKTKLADDVRRFSLESGDFPNLVGTLQKLYPNVNICMQYTDDEGDLVTITSSEEFNEALNIAARAEPRILRLNLVVVEPGQKPTIFSKPSEPALPTAAAPAISAPVVPRVASLDAIQEKIVEKLTELHTIPEPDTKIIPTTAAYSKEIAQRCALVSQELPRYTENLSNEIAAQCKRLCAELVNSHTSSLTKLVDETNTLSHDISSSCAATSSMTTESTRLSGTTTQETTSTVESAQLAAQMNLHAAQIEAKCKQLAADTNTACEDISHDIAKMIMNL
ncbi:hypothetical protein Pelo_13151 [Pelomyxa schiedti]|nr:hypothetical protein Pelo_13151 [Pelomyxa schiedti]